MRILITAYLDGQSSGGGYKFTLTKEGSYGVGWRAYHTAKGLKRFLTSFGLKIDPAFTQLHDMRESGRGRIITMATEEKAVVDGPYFWSMDQVPHGAKPYVDLCNGSYVTCYIHDDGHTVSFYRPNPNAKDVYRAFDFWPCEREYS